MDPETCEITESEFIAKVGERASVTRRQLRNLKKTGQIRGAVQRHVAGKPGSVSLYRADEVDRVIALRTARVRGRKTIAKASCAAWLAEGERALPPGVSSRSYVLTFLIDSSKDASKDERAQQLADLVRNPVDLDSSDGDRAESAYNLIEDALVTKKNRAEYPLLDLLLHAVVVKDYVDVTELDELRSVGRFFGTLFDEHRDGRFFGEVEFRQPISRLTSDPSEYLADVSEGTVELARQRVAGLYSIFEAFIDFPKKLAKLRQPVLPMAHTLSALGDLFLGSGLGVQVAPMLVAYVAKRIQVEPDFKGNLEQFVRTVGGQFQMMRRVEEAVDADPTLLDKLLTPAQKHSSA